MSGTRGRPSAYQPILDAIRTQGEPGKWYAARYDHKTRTVVSQLRTRYPGYDFRAVPDGQGTWVIEAAWRGNESP